METSQDDLELLRLKKRQLELRKKKLELQARVDVTPDPMEESQGSATDNFLYAFEKEGNLFTNARDYLEATVPLGSLDIGGTEGKGWYISPEEAYGEQWSEADTDQRLAMIAEKKTQELEEKYKGFTPDTDSMAYTAGEISKQVADPTALLPIGQGVKAVAASSAVLGGGSSLLDDVVKGEEVDYKKAAVSALVSSVAGAGLEKLTQVGKSKFQEASVKKANEIIDRAQEVINKNPPANASPEAIAEVLKESGYDAVGLNNVSKAMAKSPKKLRLKSQSDAMAEADALTTTHAHTAGRKPSEVGKGEPQGAGAKALDSFLGKMSTRLGNVSKPLERKMRQFELDLRQDFSKYHNEVEPFIKALGALNKEQRSKVGYYLSNGDFSSITDYLGDTHVLTQELPNVRAMLTEVGGRLKETGRDFDEYQGYFPRYVKDYSGLSNTFNKQERTAIQKAIADKEKVKGKSLTAEEKDKIANKVLQRKGIGADGKPSNLKQRKIATLTEEQYNQFYGDPAEAIVRYLSSATHDIHQAKFFGKFQNENLKDSIGALARDLDLRDDELSTVQDILQARFVGGRSVPAKTTQVIRNLGYMGTIGQLGSAITQLGDLGVSGLMNGNRNTIRALFNSVRGKTDGFIKTEDLALAEEGLIELATENSTTSKWLDRTLRATGFKYIDRLGKETFINAAIAKGRTQARRKPQEFIKKWGDYYGNDVDQLLRDLSQGRNSDLVKEHAFMEISRVQPVSMTEMPQAYANNPNGRLLYALKSFTLTQWDLLRREVVQEYKKGNKKNAIKFAGGLVGYLGLANTGTSFIRDMMQGESPEIKPEDIPEEVMWQMLGIYGVSKFAMDQASRRSDPTLAITEAVLPPTNLISAPFKVGKELLKEDGDPAKAMKQVPVVGNVFYNWFGGGMEEHIAKREKEQE